MSKLQIGDSVSLKKGLKTGYGHEGIVMTDEMKFRGKMEVVDVYESGAVELANYCFYSPEMLVKEN
jgi:hypothetical protein